MFYSLMNGGKKHIRLSFMIFSAVLLVAGVFFWFQSFRQRPIENNNRNQPVACSMEAKLCPNGSYVGRTGPDCEFVQCPAASFSQPIVDFPRPNEKIFSPLTVSGRAKGTWFFEASFPVKLVDEFGNLISQGLAWAKND